jgi:hypothetical protein
VENKTTTDSEKTESSPQKSYLKKITLTFREGEEDLLELIESHLSTVNANRSRNKVTSTDLIKFSIRSLKDEDITELSNQTLSAWDKIQIEVDKFNKENNQSLTMEEFLLKKLTLQ